MNPLLLMRMSSPPDPQSTFTGPSRSSSTPAEIIISRSQEERVCVFKRVEKTMEGFRGRSSHFQTLTVQLPIVGAGKGVQSIM